MSYFKVWDCISYILDTFYKRPKLGSKNIKSIFIGYAQNSKTDKFLSLMSNILFEAIELLKASREMGLLLISWAQLIVAYSIFKNLKFKGNLISKDPLKL